MRARVAAAAAMLVGAVFPSDPGLLRLFAALRATLAVLLTLLLVVLLGVVLPPHLAPSLPDRVPGFAVGLFAGAAVRDLTGRQRALTLAWCGSQGLLRAPPLLCWWPTRTRRSFW